jgi:lysophospholipase L1-like esterase
LLNKKVAFLGDSITAQNAYCSYFGLISGAIISDWGINGKCYSGGEIALQAANLVGDEDVVVMMGGTNDFNQSKVIGNIYDVTNGTITPTADTTTFCGGLHKAINDIYTKCPTVQIVIITPPQKSNGWTANSASKYLYDYAEAVKEVAKLYGIPVVDQFANCGINPVLAPMKTKYFNNDGTHPNDTYHWLLARWLYTAIAPWVKEHHV